MSFQFYFLGSLLLLDLCSKEFLSLLLFRWFEQVGQAMTALLSLSFPFGSTIILVSRIQTDKGGLVFM